MEFDSILSVIDFKKIDAKSILENLPFIKEKFILKKGKDKKVDFVNWVMGELRYIAIGNMPLSRLYKEVVK
jgi:hypothetical protein